MPSLPRAWLGVWRVSDPKITLASMASLLVGTATALADGPLHAGWLAVTVLGIFFLEAAKNASGEIFDWDSGTDQAVTEAHRSPFSGGKRVLVDGLLTRGQTWIVAIVFYALGGAAGMAIVGWREPAVLWLGLIGVAMAFFYHAPPFKLSYRGLGELTVALAYGPLIAAGAYLVQRGEVTAEVVALATPLGLLIGAFLWINEFPDAEADALANKRTLVVRLGKERAARAFGVLVSAAFAVLLLLPLAGLPSTILLGFLGAPLAYRAARRLVERPHDTPAVVPAQGWTLMAFLLYAMGASLGILLPLALASR